MSETKALVAKYQTDAGNEIELSPQIVRDYLVQGNGSVSDQEVVMFMKLCQFKGMNPFLRDAYLIKYGNNQPASIVTGKDYFERKTAKEDSFEGKEYGVIVKDEEGKIVEREGAVVFEGEKLLGGWAKIHRKGWKVPVTCKVSVKEYERFTYKDGQKKLMRNWAEMPATMIQKVALVQAERSAYPEIFDGLYSQEEMPVETADLPTGEVHPSHEKKADKKEKPKAEEAKVTEEIDLTARQGKPTKAHIDYFIGLLKEGRLTDKEMFGDPESSKETEYLGWTGMIGKKFTDSYIVPCIKKLLEKDKGEALNEAQLNAVDALHKAWYEEIGVK